LKVCSHLIFSFICMFCRSLIVLLYFFFWPLCCLFFFDIRILITSLWYLQTLLIQICVQHNVYPTYHFWCFSYLLVEPFDWLIVVNVMLAVLQLFHNLINRKSCNNCKNRQTKIVIMNRIQLPPITRYNV
jgi:hypothetical protein